jgi:hypothetical protein
MHSFLKTEGCNMPILKARPPKYCRYRNSACVFIQGHTHYLPGEFNSDHSLAAYRRLVAQRGAGIAIDPPTKDAEDTTVTVAEILEGYRSYAQAYYGNKPHGRYRNLLPIIRTVRELYADLPATDFGPKRLKVVRAAFVNAGHTQGHCNTGVQRVIAMFLVSAPSVENSVSLGQLATDAKSNEITALPELIDNIDVAGAIVTIDAAGC